MSRWIGLVLVCAVLGASPVAFAQDQGLRGELERVSGTSSAEKETYAAESVSEMREAERYVARLLEVVRREDVDAAGCVNDRLIGIRTLLKVGEGGEQALGGHLLSGSEEKAQHELRKIAIALTKVRQLRAEADACMGQVSGNDGTTTVSVEGDGELEGETEPPVIGDAALGSDPPQSSPWQ